MLPNQALPQLGTAQKSSANLCKAWFGLAALQQPEKTARLNCYERPGQNNVLFEISFKRYLKYSPAVRGLGSAAIPAKAGQITQAETLSPRAVLLLRLQRLSEM